MKANDTPRIDQTWWNKNKPATLKSTGLGKAMAAYQDSRAAATVLAARGFVDVGTTMQGFDAAEAALHALGDATDKALAACNKTLHRECIAVLGKLKKDVLSAEGRALDGDKEGFSRRAAARATVVKGEMDKLLTATRTFSEEVAARLDEVSTLEDRLADIRSDVTDAKQNGEAVPDSTIDGAQTLADAIETAHRETEAAATGIRLHVRRTQQEFLDRSLALFEKSLARISDAIITPLDVVESKALPRIAAAVERARAALKGIRNGATAAADVEREFLDMLRAFNDRGIQRSDAISGNLRSAGGLLDGADMDLLNHEEGKGHGHELVQDATMKLTQGVKSLKSITTNLDDFRKNLESFTGKLPKAADPKKKAFRPALEELLKLSQGAAKDRAELLKLTAKAQKIGGKVKAAAKQPAMAEAN